MSWKVIWKSLKSSDMRNRILAVLGMLFIFRVLAHVPIPLEDPETLKQVLDNLFTADSPQLLSFLNTISGGALANFSIMIVGLGPYINASIIMQLLTKAIPKLESLNEDGEFGRRKINQYTRILTFPLAIIQSVGAIYLVRQAAVQVGGIGDITAGVGIGQWALMITALTTGAMMLMWLGELITEQGIGNGISLLITVGIISQLPTTMETIFGAIFDSSGDVSLLGGKIIFDSGQMIFGLIMLVATLLITISIVKLNEAARNLTVNYAKRVQGNRAYGGVTTTLPVKLITAGVIPIIFAVAFLSVPSFAGQIMTGMESARLQEIGQTLTAWFANPGPQTFAAGGWEPFIYPVTYFLLVFMFTFFYTGITFDAKQIAENLQKQGGFLEGVRSGNHTQEYLRKVVSRLTLFGATALGFIAIVPIIGQAFMSSNIALGGTSILILVAVALQTLRSVESRALMVTYDQYEEPGFLSYQDDESEADDEKPKRKFGPKRKKK
ncbi:MAG: preprotein translocase subunit SecY [Candidatus Saccharibacteria bacterium]|nr:preprotein translocase subunit SecY [Candidatus Saccharibacteria bacterium]